MPTIPSGVFNFWMLVDDLTPDETTRQLLRPDTDTRSGADLTTTVAFGTGAGGWVQVTPLTANATIEGTGTDPTPWSASQNKGWKFDPDDLDTSATRRRAFIAQTVNVLLQIQASVAQATAETTYLAALYKVASGGTRSLIASARAAKRILAVDLTITLQITSPEVILASGESLLVEVWLKAPGVAVVGQTMTITLEDTSVLVDPSRVQWQSDLGGMVYDHTSAHLATMTGLATRQPHHIRLASKLATAVGVATLGPRFVRLAAKTATALGMVSAARYVKPAAKTVTMVGVPAVTKYVKPTPFVATMIGIATLGRRTISKAFAVTMTGVAIFAKRIEAARAFAVTMVGTASMSKSIIAVRQFLSALIGIPSARIDMSQDALNRIQGGGGGPTIIRKIFAIFDD